LNVRFPVNELESTVPEMVPFQPSGLVTQVPFTVPPVWLISASTARGVKLELSHVPDQFPAMAAGAGGGGGVGAAGELFPFPQPAQTRASKRAQIRFIGEPVSFLVCEAHLTSSAIQVPGSASKTPTK
jgi:hypothetical protein